MIIFAISALFVQFLFSPPPHSKGRTETAAAGARESIQPARTSLPPPPADDLAALVVLKPRPAPPRICRGHGLGSRDESANSGDQREYG